jgi:geranylgeranyl diphosphate synthase, type II
VEAEFISALRYTAWWGGKRLRPILAILAYEESVWVTCPDGVIDGLIGIELMHCYTLVHDDLPSMDNDILRRGLPTVWKQYGETMAVLVGDALQTMAFERLATLGDISVITELARSTWDLGVALGQVRDTLDDQSEYSIDDIIRVHDEKTGGFIASCLVIWGQIAWASTLQIEWYRQFGILLGRAFQIRDDILDHEWDRHILGKSVGKDQLQNKWLVSLVGLPQSKKILEEIGIQMDMILENIWSQKLSEVKEYVMTRNN